MVYINKKTRAEIYTDSVINAEGWELKENQPSPSVEEKPAPKQRKKKE